VKLYLYLCNGTPLHFADWRNLLEAHMEQRTSSSWSPEIHCSIWQSEEYTSKASLSTCRRDTSASSRIDVSVENCCAALNEFTSFIYYGVSTFKWHYGLINIAVASIIAAP
jgi:hypothetical protein